MIVLSAIVLWLLATFPAFAEEYVDDGPEVLVQDSSVSQWYPEAKGAKLEIFIEGEILLGSAAKLSAGLAVADSSQPLVTVHLASPGGRLAEALKMAVSLEKMKGQGRTVRTYVTEYSMCMSACMLLFMVGNERRVDTTSQLGFHQARSLANSGGATTEEEDALNSLISDLLVRQGVRKTVADAWRNTPPDQMFIVDGFDAIENGIATHEYYTE